MKEIKIFLASSIDEFKNERNELQCFIDDMAREFRKNYDIDIEVLRCEKVDPRYVKGRSQDEFNGLIKNSEMCIFLFFTKAGEYTIEEFEVARKAFEASENGKPKIYTYFKTINDVSVEKSVTDFMSELDKNLKHFYQTFSHIDTVKLRVLLNLKMQEMDFVSVKFEDGKCIVDGKEALDLSNVAEFANNGILKDLKLELEKIEKEYCKMKPIYATGKAEEPFCKKYAEIAARKQNLIEQIEELQKKIFNISLRMCDDEVHGKVTLRQKEAYRLFELGDLESCLIVLDSDEIDDEFFRAEKQLEKMAKENAIKYINEHKTAIDILKTMSNYSKRFNEIEQRYNKIINVAYKYKVKMLTIFEYFEFLCDNNEFKKVLMLCNMYFEFASDKTLINDFYKSKIYYYKGYISRKEDDYDKAYEYFINALDLFGDSNILNIKDSFFSAKIQELFFEIMNEIVIILITFGNYKDAKKYLLGNIDFLSNESSLNPQLNLTSHGHLALVYHYLGNYEMANNMYQKAILMATNEIDKSYKAKLPEYKCLLSNLYGNYASFLINLNNLNESLKFAQKAVILLDEIRIDNPKRFEADFAELVKNQLTNYLLNNIAPEFLENYLYKAEEILEKLSCNSPKVYEPDLAVIIYTKALYYQKTIVKKKKMKFITNKTINEYFENAYKIAKKYKDINPECNAICLHKFGFD